MKSHFHNEGICNIDLKYLAWIGSENLSTRHTIMPVFMSRMCPNSCQELGIFHYSFTMSTRAKSLTENKKESCD